MVFDLALDDNFDVFISHKGDLGIVEGRARFEQEVIFRITRRMQGMFGDLDDETIKNSARIHARRVAQENDILSRVAGFNAEFSTESPEVLEVTIFYDTGEQVTFPVEG